MNLGAAALSVKKRVKKMPAAAVLSGNRFWWATALILARALP
jgi:hypothetical protein